MQIVEVVWRNAFNLSQLIRSVGYIVASEMPGHVALAQSHDQDTNEPRGVMFIPELDLVATIYRDGAP